ncbi:MAG: hypothetical protein QM725_04710 [Lacibacter sp.]
MEFVFDAIFFLSLALFILFPLLIIKIQNKNIFKYRFLIYFFFGLIITSGLSVLFAWWNYKSDHILLTYYGYNIDGMNEKEFYGNVKPENRERVNELVTSISGIGWQLKAIYLFAYYIPYLIIIYLIDYIIKLIRKMTKTQKS